VGVITITVFVATLEETSAWLDALAQIPGIEDASYSNITETTLGTQTGYTANCSAQINLLGLSGKVLGPQFEQWAAEAKTAPDAAPADTETAKDAQAASATQTGAKPDSNAAAPPSTGEAH
jgi:hypothetical protein